MKRILHDKSLSSVNDGHFVVIKKKRLSFAHYRDAPGPPDRCYFGRDSALSVPLHTARPFDRLSNRNRNQYRNLAPFF